MEYYTWIQFTIIEKLWWFEFEDKIAVLGQLCLDMFILYDELSRHIVIISDFYMYPRLEELIT